MNRLNQPNETHLPHTRWLGASELPRRKTSVGIVLDGRFRSISLGLHYGSKTWWKKRKLGFQLAHQSPLIRTALGNPRSRQTRTRMRVVSSEQTIE
jgi:hypothetical protein